MSILLADIDATCAALGFHDGNIYHAEADAIQGLKHLIWILRRDGDNHEYRRHLGKAKVVSTDLLPMLPDNIKNEEFADVLIRLLVILTNPTPLLYRDGLPKDGPGRKIFLELVDILQNYKEAFTNERVWAILAAELQKVLEVESVEKFCIKHCNNPFLRCLNRLTYVEEDKVDGEITAFLKDWAIRSEDQGLLIERILVLVRNVLHVPSNSEAEGRADNDASLHDQVIWALQQSGMLDLVLFILGSIDENQYNLHALEIVCLIFREQTAASLADASLQRSTIEKQRDEQELIAVRRKEKQKLIAHPPPGRHSRFGGTYILKNIKSISDKDIICHQSLERAVSIDFDREKSKQKKSFRIVNEENIIERRSAFSVRLYLREYCIEILRSAYNNLVRQIRRILERKIGSTNHDDSYLLWAIRFFMEFNRLSGFELQLVSESLSVQCFHWVLVRMQHDMDMITSDKKQSRLWSKRLHVAIQTFSELLLSLITLRKIPEDNAKVLFDILQNNICYVMEYRETLLHLLMNYNESHSTKAYLRDIIDTVNIFLKIMEKFCKDPVVVQDKKRQRKKSSKTIKKGKQNKQKENNLEDKWVALASRISSALLKENALQEGQHPIPFDAASDKNIDDQKEDCMLRIYKFLRMEKFDKAVSLLRSAREVWPENDCFGAYTSSPEDELLILKEIFESNLGPADKITTNEISENENESSEENDEEENEEGYVDIVEKKFRFEDICKRLLNPRIVRACTIVLSDWEKILTKTLKSAVTILYRIAFECKCPAMLYQANLFRIFQQALNTPKDIHNCELQKLAVFVVRKFIETVPTNPKIFAELLFYKTLREANDLENNYNEEFSSTGTKGAWSEEQENELRILFEENQRNPETDKDVIVWILDNLIDKNRTRRGVLKKLKELGLTFKAPTKKSTAAMANKNLWQLDEDEQLKTLFDEFRLADDIVSKIMEVIGNKRSKRNVIKRMLELHLVADRSELKPKKPNRRQLKQKNMYSSDEESSIENQLVSNRVNKVSTKIITKNTKDIIEPKTKKSKQKTPLDISTVQAILSEVNEKFIEAIDWLKESLNDAIEDADEASEEHDDGVPLVPLTDTQREALDDSQYKKILISFGIQPPMSESESYWKIPCYLSATDLKIRASICDGSYEKNIIYENPHENSDESDNEILSEFENETFYDKKRQEFDKLVFNASDNEIEQKVPLKSKKSYQAETSNFHKLNKRREKNKAIKKFNIIDMVESDNESENDILDTENLRLRLDELNKTSSDESDLDILSKTISNKRRYIRPNIIDSDSSSNNDISNISVPNKLDISIGNNGKDVINENRWNNFEDSHIIQQKNQLLHTNDTVTADETIKAIHMPIIPNSKEENTSHNIKMLKGIQSKNNNKRELSEDSDEFQSDGIVNVKRKRVNGNGKGRKRMVIIDHDNDDDDDDSDDNDGGGKGNGVNGIAADMTNG